MCFVTDQKFGRQAEAILKKAPLQVHIKRIVAGKFRRYNGMAWYKQLLNLPTTFLNARDLLYTQLGIIQGLVLLKKLRPDVVFLKGGFVCMPIGLAAHMLKIPIVIHDSDAHPGLTNRFLARYATTIALGSPVENHTYPKNRTHYVGIPIDESFRPLVNKEEQQRLKALIGFHNIAKPLVVVTGGGLGARNINRAIAMLAPKLLDKVLILHITGEHTYEETKLMAPKSPDYIIKPFIATGMAPLFGAADVVITRAGATALQELAAMSKATIIVPNPLLTGGHQLKNAAIYDDAHAAIVIDENKMVVNPLYLKKAIEILINNPQKNKELGKRLHTFARPDAAVDMAALIAEAAATHIYQKSADH